MKYLIAISFMFPVVTHSAEAIKYKSLSMIALLASPDKFTGNRVVTSGWLYVEDKGAEPFAAVFLTKDDLKSFNTDNSIRFRFSKNQAYGYLSLTGKMVSVSGVFNSQGPEVGLQIIDPVESIQEHKRLKLKGKSRERKE